MKAFRVINVTNLATGSRGHFLQMDEAYQYKTIPVGGALVLKAESLNLLPEYVLAWAEKHWVKVYDMTIDGAVAQVAGLRMDGEITPSSINPITEMKGKDIEDEDEIDLSEAYEAKLPATSEQTGPVVESTVQMTQPSVKVSQAMQEERHSTDLSPIPGEKPVEIDESSKFTVKAPRSNQPGSVVRSSKASK